MSVLGWVWLDEYVGGRVPSDTAPGIPFAPGSPAALDLLVAFVHPYVLLVQQLLVFQVLLQPLISL